MCAALDLRAAVVTARMRGDDIGAIEDAHLMLVDTNRERASPMRVRYRVVVQVEAHIGVLPAVTGSCSPHGCIQ